METLVKMENIVKTFPGVKALSGINFEIKKGEVHVLLGENGAGKSTLMKILSGVHKATQGVIKVGEKEFSFLTPETARENGISVIYQELSVINELSIAENLFIGRLPMKKTLFFKTVDRKTMFEKARKLTKEIGLEKDVRTLVENLSISEKQQVEIAKALALNSSVLIMDEPTASLTNRETENLFKIIEKLKKQGKGIVFISHKLSEIMRLGDRVTVLKDGHYVATKKISEVTQDDLVSMMVGRAVEKNYQNEISEKGFENQEVIFEVRNLSRKDKKVKDVSFKLHKGEILGFYGLVGSGRSEMMNSIFAVEPKSNGKIYISQKEVSIKNPYQAIKNAMAMVTENRRESGFFPNFDIKENISILPFIKTSFFGGMGGLINKRNELEWAVRQKAKLNIKCYDLTQNITELSGGNQQKVILGKWLAARSQIIIFDEPTKGIDVGSKSEIYLLMRRLADEGKGVLVVSSELPELLCVCDTISVFKEGEIVASFSYKEATEEKIVKASTTKTKN